HEMVKHLAAIRSILSNEDMVATLNDKRNMLKSYEKTTVSSEGGGGMDSDELSAVFLDLGSRAIDATTMFLQRYPGAKRFRSIHCVEANPAFNGLYPPFIRQHPNVRHHNLAVGVANTTMTLSDRSIGSSIVDSNAK
ncbi:MAG: hypothetical protein CUN57_02430, partial [Phototrophicales bacterium]